MVQGLNNKMFSFNDAVHQLGITYGQAGMLGKIDGDNNSISAIVWNTSSEMLAAARAGKVGLTFGDFGKGAQVAGKIASALNLTSMFAGSGTAAKVADQAASGALKFGKEAGKTKTKSAKKAEQTNGTQQAKQKELNPEIKETMYRVATEAFRYYTQFNNLKGFVSDVERPEGVSNVRYGVTTIHKKHFGIDDNGEDSTVDKIAGLKVIVTFTYNNQQYQVESTEKNPEEPHTSNG